MGVPVSFGTGTVPRPTLAHVPFSRILLLCVFWSTRC